MTKKAINFFLKSDITIEDGILFNLEEEIANLALRNPLIIFDNNIADGQYFQKFIKKFQSIFDEKNFIPVEIKGEPTYSLLKKLFSDIEKKDFDCIVSIGGGSLLDIGKGLSLLSTNNRDPLELKGFPKNLNNPIPHITVPSVLGSGAEASFNAVFIDENEERKLGINSLNNFPIRVLVDTSLASSAPKNVIISSALDSLVHCIDSFGSKKATPVSQNFSKIGFRNSWEFLNDRDFSNPDSFFSLAIGSIFGIYALMNSGDGPTNGFAYYFGVKNRIPHGLSGGMFLKDVMKWNFNNGYSGYKEILKEIGENSHSDFFERFENLYLDLNVPKLKDFNYKIEDIDSLSNAVSNSLSGSFAGNPILFDNKSAFDVLKMQFKE